MKKIFISTAAIAVAFLTFAFSPVEKNNGMDNAQTLSQVDFEKESGICDTKYRVENDFSECNRITTLPSVLAVQSSILRKY